MKVDKNWTQKKQQKISISKRRQKEVIASDVIEEKKINNSPEPNISVLTKTTNPKVVINSENFKNDCDNLSCHSWKTFFLSLKTYNIVKELWYHIMQP